jgi:type I restriction enzyme M protein
MKYPQRFHTFLPEKGKKADLMFVQHMVASLKADGRLAVVMPHGALFRGGEEKACRRRFIQDGIRDAVIGLPPALFYGTGIPACVLVIDKAGAKERDSVLVINADREYKEGKNQNALRPEDNEKIGYVCRNRLDVPKYARKVPVAELEREDFNLNIRRYVDNSPPPEPQDVRAHLNGGVPLAEIDALQGWLDNFPDTRDLLFHPREGDATYADFASAIQAKDSIKPLIESAPGVLRKHAEHQAALDRWWAVEVREIEALPARRNRFQLRRHLLDSIAEALVPQGVMDLHQVGGGFAAYMKDLEADFKSIDASVWGPELIPDEDILQSQFPEVLFSASRRARDRRDNRCSCRRIRPWSQ